MKEKFQTLNIFHKTFILSFVFSLITFVLMIPLMIFNLGEIPFGLLLGEFISYLFCFVIGFIENKNPLTKKGLIPLVIVLSIRILVLAAASIFAAILYYQYNCHIFNVIAIIGGYFIPLIILIVLMLKEKGEAKNV